MGLPSHLLGIYPPALASLPRLAAARNMPGLVQLKELMDARTPQSVYPVVGGVAVIDCSGVMQKYADWRIAYFGGVVHTEIEQAVKAAAADPNVKAVLLRIDSPGGDVAGVSDVADAIFACRQAKRTVAFGSDLVASCGYYYASQCDALYTDSDCLVGCIGTISILDDFSKMFEEAGVKTFVFATDQDPWKGTGVIGAELTKEQTEYVQQMVDDLGHKFIEDIYRGRPSLKASGTKLPDGRVHIASKALEMGLIDGVRRFDDVLAELSGGTPAAPKGKARGEGASGGPKAEGDAPPSGDGAERNLLARRLQLEAEN